MHTPFKMGMIKDKILAILVENTPFPLFDLCMSHQRLRSFDKLLSCIDRAWEQQRPLSHLVDILLDEDCIPSIENAKESSKTKILYTPEKYVKAGHAILKERQTKNYFRD